MKTVYHLIRHAKAEKPNGDQKFPDFYRPLGLVGVTQALRLRRQLAEENVVFDLALSSPAPRAIGTLAATLTVPTEIKVIEKLYPKFPNDPINDWLLNYSFEPCGANFGYSTLRYFTEDDRITAVWNGFGFQAARDILNLVPKQERMGTRNIGIATHAVCANFIAWYLLGTVHPELQTTELGECDRLVVTLNDDGTETVEHRKLPAE